MLIVKAGRECEAGRGPSGERRAAVAGYTQELRRAGVLVELSRLEPSSRGVRVRFSGGNRLVTDGPFAETKEVIGGYWVIQVKSKEEAIEWAKRVPTPNASDEDVEIEIRQFLNVEDFVPTQRMNARPA